MRMNAMINRFRNFWRWLIVLFVIGAYPFFYSYFDVESLSEARRDRLAFGLMPSDLLFFRNSFHSSLVMCAIIVSLYIINLFTGKRGEVVFTIAIAIATVSNGAVIYGLVKSISVYITVIYEKAPL